MATPRRVFLYLTACVSLALAAALNAVFGLGARQGRGVRAIEIQLDVERLAEQIRILSGWFLRYRHRPRFWRREAVLILEYAERHRLTMAQTARDFLVAPATVYRWRKRRFAAVGGAGGWPATAKPVPPCRRISDSRRGLVADMAIAGFGGNRTIGRHLHHQGERVSARSVGRFRESPLAQESPPMQPPRPSAREPPDLLEACAQHLAGPDHVSRPRVARLLRSLADAFSEGIASDALRRTDDDESDSGDRSERALLRSRRAEQLALLLTRLSRIPPRNRPRYTDAERADILAFKYRFRLGNQTLAAWFLLDRGTLSAWTRDVDRPHERLQPLVAPLPDTAAAVEDVAADLHYVPQRLRHVVDEALTALAAKVPRREQRARRGTTKSRPARAKRRRDLAPIHARYPNHYWSADLTTLELVRQFHLVSILDLFSRDILAWELFSAQPSGEQVHALFQKAAARHGRPKHFVSDQGGQFVGEALGDALKAQGIDHRKGAVGQHGSIAIIERTWRSLKDCLDTRSVRPNVAEILYSRIAVIVDYYRTKRPHQTLGDATPAEVYRGEMSRAWSAMPAPRGWRGEATPPLPVEIRYAFPHDRRLPYLERVA